MSGVVQLREYQAGAIAELRRAYASGKRRPLLCLPTGAGKTRCAAAIVAASVALGRRVMFVAHRIELINQAVDKLREAGIASVRVIRAEHDDGDPTSAVIVASIQTISTARWQANLPQVDLVVIDECHRVRSNSYERLIAQYPGAWLLGLTATPARSDNAALTAFDHIVVGSTVRQLTELGFLVPCRVLVPLKESGGLALDPVTAYQQHADGQRAIVFAVSVGHAEALVAAYAEHGIGAGIVTGETPEARRAETLARFTAGELRVLVSVACLVEGWDDPGCAVAILARKFGHVGPYLQAIGRVLRPHPGKVRATVIDLLGSALKHGPPDLEREYSLEGKGIKKPKRNTLTQCRKCGAVFVRMAACPECGHEAPCGTARRDPRVDGSGVVDLADKLRRRRARVARFIAKFPGRCPACCKSIEVGDSVLWTEGRQRRHEVCA